MQLCKLVHTVVRQVGRCPLHCCTASQLRGVGRPSAGCRQRCCQLLLQGGRSLQ